jgi:hypothetical protein
MVARTMARLRSLAGSPIGPALLALAAALVSVSVVALTLHVYAYSEDGFSGDTARTLQDLAWNDPIRWTAAVSAVFPSALAAGLLAGLCRHSRRRLAAMFLVAWIVATAATPLLPALLGQAVGFGGPVCLDYCFAPISSTDPQTSLLTACLFFWLGPAVGESGPFAALLVGFAAWYKLVAPATRQPGVWSPSQGPPPPGVWLPSR